MTLSILGATDLAAIRGGAVDVDFDLTVVGQMVLFVVLMLILKPLLFDPMLHLFEERERRIEGAKLQARKMDEASAGALAKYEGAMQAARTKAGAERDRLRGEGQKAESDLLANVRATTTKKVDAERKAQESEVATVRAALRTGTQELAQDIATRVLGREVQG